MPVRRRKGCLGQEIHTGVRCGHVEMAEMGRFLQGELDGESVARGMLHCGLRHPKCTHSLRQLALESGIYSVPRIAQLYVWRYFVLRACAQ